MNRGSSGSKSSGSNRLSSIPSDILSNSWLNKFPSPPRSPDIQSQRQASPDIYRTMLREFQAADRTPSPPPEFSLQQYIQPSAAQPGKRQQDIQPSAAQPDKRQKEIERKRRSRALLAEAVKQGDPEAIQKHQRENARKRQSKAMHTVQKPKPEQIRRPVPIDPAIKLEKEKERHRINAMNSYWRKQEKIESLRYQASQGDAEAIAAMLEYNKKKLEEKKRQAEHQRKSRSKKRRAKLGMPTA